MKTKMPMTSGKPAAPKGNSIWPEAHPKKKNPGLDSELFNYVENGIDAGPAMPSKTKGEVNKSVLSYAENGIFPDTKCC
jgi:hypothetical protein